MKKIVLLVLCIFLGLTVNLISCSSNFDDSVDCVFLNQVPFANYDKRHFNDYELIEEDEQGRELIFCKLSGTYALNDYCDSENGTDIYFYLIIQERSNNSVRVYDNLCYLFVPSPKEITEAQLALFKKDNDWNEYLLSEKMVEYKHSQKQVDDSYDEYILSYKEEQEIIKIIKEVYGDKTVFIDSLRTKHNQKIFIMRFVKDRVNGIYSYDNTYLFTVENGVITNTKQLEGLPNTWQSQIADFKKQIDN